jgi:hypothetical protein
MANLAIHVILAAVLSIVLASVSYVILELVRKAMSQLRQQFEDVLIDVEGGIKAALTSSLKALGYVTVIGLGSLWLFGMVLLVAQVIHRVYIVHQVRAIEQVIGAASAYLVWAYGLWRLVHYLRTPVD